MEINKKLILAIGICIVIITIAYAYFETDLFQWHTESPFCVNYPQGMTNTYKIANYTLTEKFGGLVTREKCKGDREDEEYECVTNYLIDEDTFFTHPALGFNHSIVRITIYKEWIRALYDEIENESESYATVVIVPGETKSCYLTAQGYNEFLKEHGVEYIKDNKTALDAFELYLKMYGAKRSYGNDVEHIFTKDYLRLFSLDLEYKQYLKDGKVDEQLREIFERNGISLPSDVSIYGYGNDKYLFRLGTEHKQDLTDGFVSDSLRKAFDDHKFSLSSKANITKGGDYHWADWTIKDSHRTYTVEDANTHLNIYTDRSKWTVYELMDTDNKIVHIYTLREADKQINVYRSREYISVEDYEFIKEYYGMI